MTGRISGIPTTAGTFTFDVEAQDSNLIPGATADIQTLSIRIKK
ncbi:MAG: putative Ig domain-containing protein [Planctomycetes bacterium]|nr:putative Ig domain-containing protein [Planctomycetota bacterium]